MQTEQTDNDITIDVLKRHGFNSTTTQHNNYKTIAMDVSIDTPAQSILTTQVFYTYTYSTGAWLLLQSIPLIGMPRMVTTMLLDEARPPSRTLNPSFPENGSN